MKEKVDMQEVIVLIRYTLDGSSSKEVFKYS